MSQILERELWGIANLLRGKMSEYQSKPYIEILKIKPYD